MSLVQIKTLAKAVSRDRIPLKAASYAVWNRAEVRVATSSFQFRFTPVTSSPGCLTKRSLDTTPSRFTYRQFCHQVVNGAMPEKKEFQRLPLDVKPTNYSLRMHPNLKAFTFEGTEKIDVEVKFNLT